MGNGAAGTVANAALKFPDPGKDSADCKAYRAAVARWCKETNEHRKNCAAARAAKQPAPECPYRGRKFNDYHYEELNKIDPGLCARTRREVPLGVTSGSTHQSLSSFYVANRGTAAGRTAAEMRLMHSRASRQQGSAASGFWDGQRHQMNQASGGLGAGNRPFYPDGMRDGTAIEIKGPGDRESPNQYDKYATASPTKSCMKVTPKTCGEDGLTAGGRCAAA